MSNLRNNTPKINALKIEPNKGILKERWSFWIRRCDLFKQIDRPWNAFKIKSDE